MMKAVLIAAASLVFTNSAWAEPKPSVMFGDSIQSTPQIIPESSEKEARCQQMRREIDNLKGKPQRRSALDARYRAECGYKPPIVDERPYQGMQGKSGGPM
jgi:hypothetical protein